jgi:aspartyl aminopeptidase
LRVDPTMPDLVADLLRFIDASPTPYHAVGEAVRRLEAAGYQRLAEGDVWDLSPGQRRFVERGGGSLIALEIGSEAPGDAGFRLVGAHTDSPNLRLKPLADVTAQGYRQLAVEPYGGVLLHTWLDRDLSLAGRVAFRDGAALRGERIDFRRALARVPNLAIHLQRELKGEGLKLNPQKHAVPVTGLEAAPPLGEWLAEELRSQGIARIAAEQILAFDLMLYDLQPAALAGIDRSFILAPRLDNLASCHAGLAALLGAGGLPDWTRGIVLYDHEEVGSRSASGAQGTFLVETLERCCAGFKGGAPQALARARAHSLLISADMAHAVHPNYADKHEPGHRPVIGRGPVIKVNQEQSYASDALTAGRFAGLCGECGVVPQHFAARSDVGCGSTIGPISAARTGIPTVDVGNPMLSMHSAREMAGAADVAPLVAVLTAFFEGEGR